VEARHAVHRGGADDRQIGHPHGAFALLVDQAHAGQTQHVPGPHGRDLSEETPVDLVDDLHVPRQQALHQRDAPLLQGLRQHGVVRVAGAGAGDRPGGVPVEPLAVHQQAHQFGDDQRGMGLVELDEGLFGQQPPVAVFEMETPQDVLQGTGDEEVLLPQTQLFSGQHIVVGVKNLGEVFRQHFVLNRLNVRPFVEVIKVEFVIGPRRPEPQGVDAVAVSDDRQIVRDPHDLFGLDPAPLHPAVGDALDPSAEMDDLGVFRPRHFPGRALFEPVVRFLDLLAVHNPLLEDAVVITQPVPHAGQVERRHGIQEAGGEPAETAVAQSGVDLDVAQGVPVDAVIRKRLLAERVHFQVDDIVAEQAPDQEFERQVVDAFDILITVAGDGFEPAFDETVAHAVGESRILVKRRSVAHLLGEGVTHMPGIVFFQPFDAHFNSAVALPSAGGCFLIHSDPCGP